MALGDIDVTQVEEFDHSSTEMGHIAGDFSTSMAEVANNSASPEAHGKMEQGATFMQKERQARELLAQHMTKTSDGLTGYQTAVASIGEEHKGLLQLTDQRMRTLLRPHEGPMATNDAFDWQDVLAYQAQHPDGGGN